MSSSTCLPGCFFKVGRCEQGGEGTEGDFLGGYQNLQAALGSTLAWTGHEQCHCFADTCSAAVPTFSGKCYSF